MEPYMRRDVVAFTLLVGIALSAAYCSPARAWGWCSGHTTQPQCRLATCDPKKEKCVCISNCSAQMRGGCYETCVYPEQKPK
jgi:hypothetical protein